MKVVTWNVRLGLQQGLDALVHELSGHAPDLLAIQEVGRHWWMGPAGDTTATLSRALALPYHMFVPCIRMSGGREYGHALLSRTPFRTPKILPLPQLSDEPRRMLHVTVLTPDGPLDVLSTHLSHIDDRKAQGPMLTRYFASLPEPALLLGDLNEVDAPWLSELAELGVDTGQHPTFPANQPQQRIDYVIGKGLKLGQALVPDTGSASDHRPVVVEAAFTS